MLPLLLASLLNVQPQLPPGQTLFQNSTEFVRVCSAALAPPTPDEERQVAAMPQAERDAFLANTLDTADYCLAVANTVFEAIAAADRYTLNGSRVCLPESATAMDVLSAGTKLEVYRDHSQVNAAAFLLSAVRSAYPCR